MKWFKHFTNSRDNNKLSKIRMKYGAEGYAIYWYCLELIAGDLGVENDITFELKHDSEVIAFNLKMDTLKVQEIMQYMVELKLFDNSQGVITCLKLAKYLDKKVTRNKEIHKIIDSYNEKISVGKLSGTVSDSTPTVPKQSPLDVEVELDLDKYSSSSSSDAREKFCMFEGWKPDIDQPSLNLITQLGITQAQIDDQVINYKIHHLRSDGDKRTQHQWSRSFISTITKFANSKKGKSNEKSSGNGKRGFDAGAHIASEAAKHRAPQ